ncbi:hypothetical protein [Paraburkholderia sp. GAS32]|uniref:hypothetical protein n=1 Tax=Paraburkholderia sp. GAS32 TaxID=3035129 RepID=UPI003D245E81
MDSTNIGLEASKNKLAPTYTGRHAIELLSILLNDVANDAEVAARESEISDASFMRLRRAMDRVACAQSVLETMRVRSAGASDEETALRVRMREAVDLLARAWPEDYPAGAVEWLLLQLSPL